MVPHPAAGDDDGIRRLRVQATKERQGIFVGARPHRSNFGTAVVLARSSTSNRQGASDAALR